MAPSIEGSSLSSENGFSSSPHDERTYERHEQSPGRRSHDFVSQTKDGVYHFAVKEVPQLPSPSLSPHLSPSLTASSAFDENATLQQPARGRKHSGSFEQFVYPSLTREENDSGVISSPPPISKSIPAHELHDIPEESVKKPRKLSSAKANGEVLKLTAEEVTELTSAPESLPVSPTRLAVTGPTLNPSPVLDETPSISETLQSSEDARADVRSRHRADSVRGPSSANDGRTPSETPLGTIRERPKFSSRTSSNQATLRTPSFAKTSLRQPSPRRKPLPNSGIEPLDLNQSATKEHAAGKSPLPEHPPSPVPQSIPLPPASIPTYLQLELSSTRPSPLYIYRSQGSDTQYESSRIKFERLLNFLILPPQLEQVLLFGSLACLDAWLYTFTILPLRFFKALAVLAKWWVLLLVREAKFIAGFIYHGSGRMWHRQRGRGNSVDSASRSRSVSRVSRPPMSTTSSFQLPSRTPDTAHSNGVGEHPKPSSERKSRPGWGRRHRRSKSTPSTLSSYHKADLLQGAVIIGSCIILLRLDASRMYHGIRGQSAIKLYVIYNLLEVCYTVATISIIH